MKQEKNNEIDLLLRRLGRRPDGGVSGPEGGHLDADELSSYAENALPPSARARYTEHLAQCSSCRTLVVQLSSAVGVVVAPERAVVPEPSGFRKFLASLLSPLVLRYAIPALGLAVIAVIGLTVFRPNQQQQGADVAQQTNAPAPANELLKAPAAAGSGDNYKAEVAKTAPAATPGDGPSATPDAGSINMSKAPTPAPTALDRISAPVGEANAAATVDAAPPKPVPPVTNSPAPSPTPTDTRIDERQVELEKEAVQRQTEAARAPQRALQARDEGRRSANEATPTTASAPKKKGEFSVSPQVGRGVGVQRDAPAEKDSDDAEIRAVAGRRFRKQRGVWVDTAYDSSTETTNLTRGSERYRALVADEPGIKNIADQLDGEIIVVWKGRPYRIR